MATNESEVDESALIGQTLINLHTTAIQFEQENRPDLAQVYTNEAADLAKLAAKKANRHQLAAALPALMEKLQNL